MNFLTSIAAFLLVGIGPAFALTEADITPEALVGKTLTFTVVNGTAPLPTPGIWKGTFAASGDGFTVENISAGIESFSTTYSTMNASGVTQINLANFGAINELTLLYLYFVEGLPNFTLQGPTLSEGTFSIDSPAVDAPEIDVQQPQNSSLKDGVSKKSFGTVKLTKTGAPKKFVIKNIGNAPLTDLAITIDGKNKSDFKVSTLKKKQLAKDQSVEFTVKFKPSASGKRKATLHIKSNDEDESSFDIAFTGTGKAAR